MNMNKLSKIYGTCAFLLLAVSNACVETAPDYEKADPAGTAEVYFPEGLKTSYNLKDYDGKITIDVKRVNSDSQLSVPLTVSADPIFSVPSNVTFSSGSASATIDFTYDLTKIEAEKSYPVSISIGSEATPYGMSKYEFNVSVPAVWNVWKKGHMVEVWWGEDENETLYYQDMGDDVWYCYIDNCFDTGGGAAPTKYYFYWDKKTNFLKVPMQYMGWTTSEGYKVYVSDAESFYTTYLGGEDAAKEKAKAKGFDSVADWMYSAEGLAQNRPYYDGNGGFFLGDYYAFGPEAGDNFGRGYQFGGDQDYFIAEGFVRIVDYNDDKHIGSSKALYEGAASSIFFSNDGGITPVEFDASLRYDAAYEDSYLNKETGEIEVDKIPAELTTTYYLADYFGEGHALAFTAPALQKLETGSEISDVENDQKTGISVFGNDIYVSVKKGSVEFVEGSEFPTITIELKVYAKDSEGNKTFDFGTVKETFEAKAYGKDNYTLDDIYGGEFKDYLGVWKIQAYDYFDKTDYEWEISISDGGLNSEGKQLAVISNLSGLADKFDDGKETVTALFDNYCLFVTPQVVNGTYKGSTVQILAFDPDSENVYDKYDVLCGICSDGALAFVNRYAGANLSGIAYWLPETEKYMTIFSNIFGFGIDASSVSCHVRLAPEQETALSGSRVRFTKVSGTQRQKTVLTSARKFTLNPAVKSEKTFVETIVK